MRQQRKEMKRNSKFIHQPKEKDESKEKSFENNALLNYLFFDGQIENFLYVPWGMKNRDKEETKH